MTTCATLPCLTTPLPLDAPNARASLKAHACHLCTKSYSDAHSLKVHKAFKHDIAVIWHQCNLCDSRFKSACGLKEHKAYKHDVGVKWHQCTLCKFKGKRPSDLVKHMHTHGIAKKWHLCECGARFGDPCSLRRHRMRKHGVGLVFHKCDAPGCAAIFKTKSDLKAHQAKNCAARAAAAREVADDGDLRLLAVATAAATPRA
jgi:uncharacterized Zn-finger protein